MSDLNALAKRALSHIPDGMMSQEWTKRLTQWVQDEAQVVLDEVCHLHQLDQVCLRASSAMRAPCHEVREMALQTAQDIRYVLLYVAVYLAKLEYAKASELEVQEALAHHVTMLIIPLANYCGFGALKGQMEDWCLRYMSPVLYHTIAQELRDTRARREATVDEVLMQIKRGLSAAEIPVQACFGRAKHIASMARKMEEKSRSLHELCDALACRIIVTTKEEAYHILAWLTEHYQTDTDEFDDYIAAPKPNGYQSLHVVISYEGQPVEVQIRTKAMDLWAESGIAAHWMYKEKHAGVASTHHDWRYGHYAIDWLNDFIYVFTPQNEVKRLVKGVPQR